MAQNSNDGDAMKMSEAKEAALIHLGSAAFNSLDAGGKAASLHKIKAAGFPVPAGFVVPADADLDQIEAELEDAVMAIGGYLVAARSSAYLEDLPDASFAGQYTTQLEIMSLPELLDAIAMCRASAGTPQVVSYLQKKNEFHHDRPEVSVLVQKTVDVAVAGVAFSIHPHPGR